MSTSSRTNAPRLNVDMKPRDNQSNNKATSPKNASHSTRLSPGKAAPDSPFQAFIVNENGEEIPITDGMVEESMRKAKLKSIGAHTGYTKVITDEMIASRKKEQV